MKKPVRYDNCDEYVWIAGRCYLFQIYHDLVKRNWSVEAQVDNTHADAFSTLWLYLGYLEVTDAYVAWDGVTTATLKNRRDVNTLLGWLRRDGRKFPVGITVNGHLTQMTVDLKPAVDPWERRMWVRVECRSVEDVDILTPKLWDAGFMIDGRSKNDRIIWARHSENIKSSAWEIINKLDEDAPVEEKKEDADERRTD